MSLFFLENDSSFLYKLFAFKSSFLGGYIVLLTTGILEWGFSLKIESFIKSSISLVDILGFYYFFEF